MAESGNTILSGLFQLANTWSAPLAQKVVYGGQATPNSIVAEKATWNSLNGSGANDTATAAKAPQGFLDFMQGKNTGASDTGATAASKAAAGMSNTSKMLLIGGALLVVAFIFYRALAR